MTTLSAIKAFFKATFLTKCFSLISQIFLGIYLSQEDFGIYGLVLSLTVFTSFISGGIIQKILVQKGKAFHDHRRYAPISTLFAVLSLICLIFLATVLTHEGRKFILVAMALLLGAAGVMQALVPIQKAILLSNSRFNSVAKVETGIAGLNYLFTIPLSALGLGPYSFLLHKPFVHLFEYIKYNKILINYGLEKIQFPKIRLIKRINLLEIFKEFKWLMLAAIFTAITLKGDYFVLGFFVDIYTIGLYFFAYQLSLSIGSLFTASILNNVLLPKFSNLDSLEAKNQYLYRTLLVLFILFCPLFFVLGFFIDKPVIFIWGDKWIESIIIIKFLLFVTPLRMVPSVFRVYLESNGKWGQGAILLGVSALGIIGAAICGGLINTSQGIAIAITTWISVLGISSSIAVAYYIKNQKIIYKLLFVVGNSYGILIFYNCLGLQSIFLFLLLLSFSGLINLWIVRKDFYYFTDEVFGKSYATLWSDRIKSLYRFVLFHKRVPNLLNPVRITDLILKKRLTWSRKSQIEIVTADKLNLRGYVKNNLGNGYLPKLYGVMQKGERFDFDSFEYPCVLKSNHGTSHVLFLESRDSFNEEKILGKVNEWLEEKWFPVWYRHIQPKIICEEFLSLNKKFSVEGVPNDFKFFVFNGKVEFVCVDLTRFNGHKRSLFTKDWELIDVEYLYPKGGDQKRPHMLEEMIEVSEKLAGPLNFVRVDLYLIGDRIIVGELTHSPDAGRMRFNPNAFDYFLDKRS